MSNILMGVQVVLGILLVISIMPQDSNALPSEFGGEGSQAYFKPKGKQAFLARVTKITAVLFL